MGVTVPIHQPTRGCPPGYRKLPEHKPDSLPSISNALWGDLVERLNPLVVKLNRGNLTALAIFFIAFVATFLFQYLGVGLEVRIPLAFIFFPIIICFMLFQCVQLAANAKIDQQIVEAVSDLESRFASEGHTVRYVTKNTGFCKPKYSQTERYLDFLRTATDDAGDQDTGASFSATPTATADIESPMPPANSGANFSPTPTTNKSAGTPSVVDQMMADLQRPL